jgi:hypothetical protein
VPSTMATRKGCFSVVAMSGAAAFQNDWAMVMTGGDERKV